MPASVPELTWPGSQSRSAAVSCHCWGVLSFRSAAREVLGSETARVHHAHWKGGGCVAAHVARIAARANAGASANSFPQQAPPMRCRLLSRIHASLARGRRKGRASRPLPARYLVVTCAPASNETTCLRSSPLFHPALTLTRNRGYARARRQRRRRIAKLHFRREVLVNGGLIGR